MAKYQYDVKVNTGMSFVTLTNVQSFSVTRGRQQVQDPFRAATAVITGIRPDDLPTIDIGSPLLIECPTVYVGSPISAPLTIFFGVVSDVSINYGYTASMDTYQITCEDAIAAAGRSYVTGGWAAGLNVINAATTLGALGGVTISFVGGANASGTTVSAQSFTDANMLDILNILVATEQSRIFGIRENQIGILGRGDMGTGGVATDFTDGTLATSNPISKFSNIIFKSLADSYFTKAIVEPVGLAAQTAGTGNRVFTMSSYDQTTTQGKDLASYVLSSLQDAQDIPSTVSCIAENQSNNSMIIAAAEKEGAIVGVILRGTRYNCFIEGSTITADPSQTMVQLTLSSAETRLGFILDSPILGVLDQNKLGF